MQRAEERHRAWRASVQGKRVAGCQDSDGLFVGRGQCAAKGRPIPRVAVGRVDNALPHRVSCRRVQSAQRRLDVGSDILGCLEVDGRKRHGMIASEAVERSTAEKTLAVQGFAWPGVGVRVQRPGVGKEESRLRRA